jgi:pimeloyl-ACP methyl ester carboxylesterase
MPNLCYCYHCAHGCAHGAGSAPRGARHGRAPAARPRDRQQPARLGPVVERLAARRTVIAVDLPGFGTSPPLTPSGPPPAPAGFAGILTDFLGQLGHRTAHIAGHSVGGWTALEMAKLGTAQSVVALSPAGLWARRMPLYDVLSLRGTRRLCRLLDPLLPALLARPLGRRLMLWQNIARPERVPPRPSSGGARFPNGPPPPPDLAGVPGGRFAAPPP